MRSWILLPLLLVGCGKTLADDLPGTEAAPATGVVRVASVAVDTSGTDLRIRVRVENGTNAPVFAVSDFRRAKYDEASHVLDVAFAEHVYEPNGSSGDCHYMLPRQREVAPRTIETFEAHLMKTQPSIAGYPARHFGEAKIVNVEVGVSDARFTIAPGVEEQCHKGLSEHISQQQRAILNGTWRAGA